MLTFAQAVSEGRMSTNGNGRSQGLLDTNRSDQQSSLSVSSPSAALRPQRSTDLGSTAPREVAEDDLKASIEFSGPVDLERVNEESWQYDNRPDEAQIWLKAFGNLKPGTDVSENLRVLNPQSEDVAEKGTLLSSSILPFLTRWLRLWFDGALAARKNAQKSQGNRPHTLKEQGYLHWLCRFIRDYLGLDHASLALSDVQSLLTCLLDICIATSEPQDIEDSVDVLHASLLRWPYPAEILEQTLHVLSRVRFYFNRHSTPTRLADCIEILAKGQMHQEVMRILYSSTNPILMNGTEMTPLRVARGSMLLLRGMINSTLPDGSFVVEYTKLMPALLEGAEARVLRLCADILDICHEFLKEGPRLRETISNDWDVLMRVIRRCAEPFQSDGAAITKNSRTVHSSIQIKAGESPTDHASSQLHLEAVRQVNEILSHLLNKLMDSKSMMVYEYFMTFPESLTEPQCMAMLQYASERHLLFPQDRNWALQIDTVSEKIIQDTVFSTAIRSRAVELLGNVISSEESPRADGSEADPLNGAGLANAKIMQILSDLMLVEKDPGVLRQIISSLQEFADKSEYALQIVQIFRDLILAEGLADEDAENRIEIATDGLLKVFLKNLTCNSQVGIAAFEATIAASGLRCSSRKARLSALKLLFRLRCDSEGVIFFENESDSEYIAAALCRTRASADEYDGGNVVPQRGSASNSSITASLMSNHPLWMYPDLEPLCPITKISVSTLVARGHPSSTDHNVLDVGLWLLSVIQCLQSDTDWETYSFIIVHLGSQLSNTDLFIGCLSTVVKLRQVLSDQITKASFLEPPTSTGLKKHDVAICIFNVLTPLISFATIKSEHIQKGFGDDLVRCFLSGIAQFYEGTSTGCIHALSICCLELPASVASSYPAIVERMSKNMTQSHLTMHILEFLAQVARLPQVHSNFREDEITMIFSICIQFLEKAREQHPASGTPSTARLGTPSGRPTSGINFKRPPYRAAMTQDIGLPLYTSALAYHTMIFWFLSLKLEIRAKYVSWIVPRLVWKNAKGEEIIDEQSQAFVDMMQRAAFSDLGETLPHSDFANSADGAVSSASWIVGLSIITVETAGHTGITQITKRQASGTTYAMYRQFTAELPAHHAPSNTEILPQSADALPTEMLPSHILLQMVATAAPTSTVNQPIPLPKDDFVTRALSSFDRIPTVDSHKIGILYIGHSQSKESEYLANTTASSDFDTFLHNLGYPVSLEPPLRFNPMGLTCPRDGKTTIAWRDRVTEIIYHVPTLMPTNLEDDPQCVAKKAHVGNDHVNIIFNESGMPWNFENFKSQLNYVNIVITPASRPVLHTKNNKDSGESLYASQSLEPAFYRVYTLTKPSFPHISPAADPKIISAAQLPQFVRMLALNANVYSQAWNAREIGDTEFPSNWRARLQELKRLRERVLARMCNSGGASLTIPGQTVASPGQGRKAPVPVPAPKDRERYAEEPNTDGMLAERLDFSRWTL